MRSIFVILFLSANAFSAPSVLKDWHIAEEKKNYKIFQHNKDPLVTVIWTITKSKKDQKSTDAELKKLKRLLSKTKKKAAKENGYKNWSLEQYSETKKSGEVQIYLVEQFEAQGKPLKSFNFFSFHKKDLITLILTAPIVSKEVEKPHDFLMSVKAELK